MEYSKYVNAKRWVISDIHGCYRSFRTLLEQKVQLTKQDRLFLLGDYIDRGPGSKAVLDYVIWLRQEGYQIETLLGNHEDVMIRCYENEIRETPQLGYYDLKDSWLYFGGKDTLKSFGVERLVDLPPHYIQLLKAMPFYKSLPDFVLVHAGLNMLISDPFSDKLSMLWAKDFPIDKDKVQNRQIIHGHVPRTLSQIEQDIAQEKTAISIDNGCVYHRKAQMGNLLALELNELRLVVQGNVDFAPQNFHSFAPKPSKVNL